LPINSYQGDSTAWFEYLVDQAGTWKLKFDFPGNYSRRWYFNGRVYATREEIPGGQTGGMGFGGPANLQSAYYSPSTSIEQTLTVQENWFFRGPQQHYQPTTGCVPYPSKTENGGPSAVTTHSTDKAAVTTGQQTQTLLPATTSTLHMFQDRICPCCMETTRRLAGIAGGQFGYRSVGPAKAHMQELQP